MLVPCGVEPMEAYPVSTRVNNVRNEGAELIAADVGEVEEPVVRRKKKGEEQRGLFG
jgi:hypothetical protein